jgi:hypothetical protein
MMLGLLILVFALCWLVAIVAGGVYLCVTRVQVEQTKRFREAQLTERARVENAWLSQGQGTTQFELPAPWPDPEPRYEDYGLAHEVAIPDWVATFPSRRSRP